jgi:hypothetical protein
VGPPRPWPGLPGGITALVRVTTTSFSTPASDGQGEIGLRWYTTASAARDPRWPTPTAADARKSVGLCARKPSWYAASGVPFLSVELRLALEATSPASLAEDVFSGLTWRRPRHGPRSPGRIAVMATAAAAAQPFTPRSWPVTTTRLAAEIPVYPMPDDRNDPGPLPAHLLT